MDLSLGINTSLVLYSERRKKQQILAAKKALPASRLALLLCLLAPAALAPRALAALLLLEVVVLLAQRLHFAQQRRVLENVRQDHELNLRAAHVHELQFGLLAVALREHHVAELAVHAVLALQQVATVHLSVLELHGHGTALALVQQRDGHPHGLGHGGGTAGAGDGYWVVGTREREGSDSTRVVLKRLMDESFRLDEMVTLQVSVGVAALVKIYQSMTATESALELGDEDDISQSFVALNLTPRRPKRIYKSDRFIPARSAMDFDYCHHMMTTRTKPTASNGTSLTGDTFASHNQLLAANLLYNSPSYTQPRSLLAIRASAVHGNQLLDDASHTVRIPCPVTLPLQPTRKTRTLPSPRCSLQPFTSVLDAPGLRDDYYLNLIAWGTNGVVAIALGQCVYLYTTITRKIQKLRACSHQVDYVTSVAWLGSTSSTGNRLLAVGTLLAELQIWDVETCTKVRWMRSHNDRINSLSWSGYGTLATGSRDAVIHLHDVRCVRHVMAKLAHHREEVCGLAWSPDGGTLASGSNDKYLCFWDRAMVRSNGPGSLSSPRSAHLHHYAAVRALAWSPWERHVLASGGGAADGTIKLWDASTGRLQCSVSTGSQICALVWSTSTPELVSAHGLGSMANQITLWDHATMEQVRHLTGHSARVLHLALSPNGSSVASAGADETLRFWNVFPGSQSTWTPRSSGLFGTPAAVIR